MRNGCTWWTQAGGDGSHDLVTWTITPPPGRAAIVRCGGSWFAGSRYGIVDAQLSVWTQPAQPETRAEPTCQPTRGSRADGAVTGRKTLRPMDQTAIVSPVSSQSTAPFPS